VRFPIPRSPHIRIDNALRLDWNEVLPAERASFVFGNPPFLGKQQRSDEQQEDMQIVFEGETGAGVLDYVAAWYLCSMVYAEEHPVQFAYVSTNSITQGEQVPALWRTFYLRGFEVTFAHRTSRGRVRRANRARALRRRRFAHAGVRPGARALYEYPDITGAPVKETVREINCYLARAFDDRRTAKCAFRFELADRFIRFDANDDGGLIVSKEEAKELFASDPSRRATYAASLVHAIC